MALRIRQQLANFVKQSVPPPKSEILDHIPPELRDFYVGVFCVADEGCERGSVETTAKRWEIF